MTIYPKPPTFTLEAGRSIVKNGTPLFTMHGSGNYDPCELDALAKTIVASLNRMETAGRLWVSKDWSELTPVQQANNMTLAAESDEILDYMLHPGAFADDYDKITA
jgi:hypothetical protein